MYTTHQKPNHIRPHKTNHRKTPAELEAKYLETMHGAV